MLKMAIALVCFTTFAGCALDDAEVLPEDSQVESGLLAGSSSDLLIDPSGKFVQFGSSDTPTAWLFCNGYYFDGTCAGGSPVRIPDLGVWPYDFQGLISSIRTTWSLMETWNGINFTGTYGYFEAYNTRNVLSYPYDNAISSISYPGA